jgi:hypothetical protein
MAVRKCPQCLAVVSRGHAAAYSNSIECPGCKAKLEVSTGSRYLSTLAGLLAAFLVWRFDGMRHALLGWVAPTLVCFLAYGIVAPVVLMLIADLRLKSEAPPGEPVHEPAGTGHTQGHQ